VVNDRAWQPAFCISRKKGGGRTARLEQEPDINDACLTLLKEHTAGDLMDEKVKWTNLSRADISSHRPTKGDKISRNIVSLS